MLTSLKNNQQTMNIANANLLDFFKLFGLYQKSFTHGEAHILQPGVSDALCNVVCFPIVYTTQAIDEMNQVFLEKKQGFCWFVDEDHVSQEVLNVFNSERYTLCDDVKCMAMDVQEYTKPQPMVTDITIDIVRDHDRFKEWVHIVAEGFEVSVETEQLYLDKLSHYLGTEDVFIPIAAYKHGKMVATASLFFSEGTAAFSHGVTLEAFRRQGISSAFYHERFEILKKKGIKTAVIQTFPMATSLALKAGFKIIGNNKLYMYNYDK